MPARLLAEWMAFYQVEPFGPPAAFVRSGIIASQIHNVNRTKQSQPVAKPTDFLPKDMMLENPPDDETLGERNAQAFRAAADAMERYGK